MVGENRGEKLSLNLCMIPGELFIYLLMHLIYPLRHTITCARKTCIVVTGAGLLDSSSSRLQCDTVGSARLNGKILPT